MTAADAGALGAAPGRLIADTIASTASGTEEPTAERLGNQTRFPSLTLGVNVQQGQRSLSWTRGGVLIPSEEKAAAVREAGRTGAGGVRRRCRAPRG